MEAGGRARRHPHTNGLWTWAAIEAVPAFRSGRGPRCGGRGCRGGDPLRRGGRRPGAGHRGVITSFARDGKQRVAARNDAEHQQTDAREARKPESTSEDKSLNDVGQGMHDGNASLRQV